MKVTYAGLLSVLVLAAFDVLYFHTYRCRLPWRREARWENLSHAFRSVTAISYLLLAMHVRLEGHYWFGYCGLVGFDVLNTAFDAVCEATERRAIGGVSPGEYIVHIVLGLLAGGIFATMLWESWPLAAGPTRISWSTLDVPLALRLPGYLAILGLALSGGLDLSGFLRALQREPARAAQAARAAS